MKATKVNNEIRIRCFLENHQKNLLFNIFMLCHILPKKEFFQTFFRVFKVSAEISVFKIQFAIHRKIVFSIFSCVLNSFIFDKLKVFIAIIILQFFISKWI